SGLSMFESRGAWALLGAACLSILALAVPATPANAQCLKQREEGEWTNVYRSANTYTLTIRMIECGDQILNGQQTETRYKLEVRYLNKDWTLSPPQSASASYRTESSGRWLYGEIYLGGYVDEMWMRVVPQSDGEQMEVQVHNRSLSMLPSGDSAYTFQKGFFP